MTTDTRRTERTDTKKREFVDRWQAYMDRFDIGSKAAYRLAVAGEDAGQKADEADPETLRALVQRLADEHDVDVEALVEALADVSPGLEALRDELAAATPEPGQKATLDADTDGMAEEAVERATREMERRIDRANRDDLGKRKGRVRDPENRLTDDTGRRVVTGPGLTDREAERILERDLDLDEVEADESGEPDEGELDPRIEDAAGGEDW